MKQPKTFLLLGVVVAVLILGIAYAAIQDVDFTVEGSATATPSDANYKIAFDTNVNIVKDPTDMDATVTSTAAGNTANLTVAGLKTVGDKVTLTYTIRNTSTDIDATVEAPVVTNSNTTNFDVKAVWGEEGTTIEAVNGSKTLVVTVELIKAPVDADVSTNITVTANTKAVSAQ